MGCGKKHGWGYEKNHAEPLLCILEDGQGLQERNLRRRKVEKEMKREEEVMQEEVRMREGKISNDEGILEKTKGLQRR